MRSALNAIVILGLLGVAQSVDAGSKESLASLKAASDGAHGTYIACMENAGRIYSRTDAQPGDIADAAQSKCSDPYYAFLNAMQSYLQASAGRKFLADQARDQANLIAVQVREKTKGRVMALVLDTRLIEAAP